MTEGGGRGGWGDSGTPGTEASMAGLAMVNSGLSICVQIIEEPIKSREKHY